MHKCGFFFLNLDTLVIQTGGIPRFYQYLYDKDNVQNFPSTKVYPPIKKFTFNFRV